MVGRDIKGAFNHLWHPRVKWHLLNINLPITVAKTLCHFLDGRTAKIKIKNFIGTPFSILAGVPQGASPSAKIFNLVIRLSPNPPPDLWHQYDSNFADDCTQIIASHKSKGKNAGRPLHSIHITKAIKRQNDFEYREGLITEPAKTWILPISSHILLPVIINEQQYKVKWSKVKMLGLKLSGTNFINAHIAEKCAIASKELNTIKKLFKDLDKTAKMSIIKSKVLTHLLYPPIPLHLACKTQMKKLQGIQNKALQFVHNVDYTQRITAKRLHLANPTIRPVNQELYWRARRTWNSILEGVAGDRNQLDKIISMEINSNDTRFPSSYEVAINGSEPPPRYTERDYH